MLKGDDLQKVVVNIMGSVPIVIEVSVICLFLSVSRTQMKVTISTNVSDPMRHQVNCWTVEVGRYLVRNDYPITDIILCGTHFAPWLAQSPSISICYLVDFSHLLKLLLQCTEVGLHISSSSPMSESIFERVKLIQRALNVVQCCIIMRWTSSIHRQC
jgi:hypothetical protein